MIVSVNTFDDPLLACHLTVRLEVSDSLRSFGHLKVAIGVRQ
jgi:hypothetical protein